MGREKIKADNGNKITSIIIDECIKLDSLLDLKMDSRTEYSYTIEIKLGNLDDMVKLVDTLETNKTIKRLIISKEFNGKQLNMIDKKVNNYRITVV